jgi:hypothetical protein
MFLMLSHDGSTSNATTLRSQTDCSTGFALGGSIGKQWASTQSSTLETLARLATTPTATIHPRQVVMYGVAR